MKKSLFVFFFFTCFLTNALSNSESGRGVTGKGVLEDIKKVSISALLFFHNDLNEQLGNALKSGGINEETHEKYSTCLKLKSLLATKAYTECVNYSLRKLKDENLPLWLQEMLAQGLTTSYFKMGMLDKGEQAQSYYYSLVKKSREESGQSFNEYMLSAEFYFDAKEYQSAVEKYKKSYYEHLQNSEQNAHFKGFLCNNIALTFLELKKYDSVVKYNDLAREHWNSEEITENKHHYNALLNANTAKVYAVKGREKEAIPLLYNYMKGCENIDYHHYLKSFVDLAKVYLLTGDFNSAEKILDSLDKDVRLPIVDDKLLLQKYFTHYRILTKKGQYEKAEEFLNQYLHLSAEKYNENKRRELKQYALLYDIHEKQKELEYVKIENLEHEQIQGEQRLVIWIIVSSIIIILALLIIVYGRYKYQKKISYLTQERKAMMEKALTTRETMLREVHHRIKNNLNTINGLFHLQLKSANSEDLKEQLQKSANRVFSIAQIHNMLYEESFLENVEMKEYFNVLCSHLIKTSNSDIDLSLEVDAISLNMDYALPLGLVLNELFTNSIKHAFNSVEKGAIYISLVSNDNSYVLTYRDNGPGYDINQGSDSLGLKLILMMKKQLKADVITNSKNGSEFEFRFKVSD